MHSLKQLQPEFSKKKFASDVTSNRHLMAHLGDLKITSTSTERQKRSQNLAPVLVIISGNSLVFSRKIITSTGFYRCCAPGASAPVVVKNQSPIPPQMKNLCVFGIRQEILPLDGRLERNAQPLSGPPKKKPFPEGSARHRNASRQDLTPAGSRAPLPNLSLKCLQNCALLRKRPVLLKADCVLTKDRKRPYCRHFCGKMHRVL